jgi:hypothetical protein
MVIWYCATDLGRGSIQVRFKQSLLVFALSAMAFAPSSPVLAQGREDDAELPDTVNIRTEPLDTIEVIGERPLSHDEISSDIYELAQSNRFGAPIPRFHDPLCLHVSGLGQQLEAEVAELIRDNARDATMEVAAPGCSVNALVILVDNPERLVERMRETRPELFDPRSKSEIRAATHRNDPVIAWNIMTVRNRDGRSLTQASALPGGIGATAGQAFFDNPASNIPMTDTWTPSRYTINYSYARAISVVIFDVRRLEGVHLNQLADYATMYLIGSPRRLLEHEKLAGTSIMTLFEAGPLNAPIGLTRLDRAYLRGLYSLKPNENSRRLAASTRVAYEQIAGNSCGSDDEPCENDAS